MFASEVHRIISMRDFKTIKDEDKFEKVFEDLDNFNYEGKYRFYCHTLHT